MSRLSLCTGLRRPKVIFYYIIHYSHAIFVIAFRYIHKSKILASRIVLQSDNSLLFFKQPCFQIFDFSLLAVNFFEVCFEQIKFLAMRAKDVYISQDYAKAIQQERKVLIKAMFQAKERGLSAKVIDR